MNTDRKGLLGVLTGDWDWPEGAAEAAVLVADTAGRLTIAVGPETDLVISALEPCEACGKGGGYDVLEADRKAGAGGLHGPRQDRTLPPGALRL
jgi:hypothetical protein